MQRHKKCFFQLATVMTLATAGLAYGQVYRKNLGTPPIIIPGVAADHECGDVPFQGHVVKRIFDDGGLLVTGFVLEAEDGSRKFINVYIFGSLGRADMGDLINGLQRVLKEGQFVSGYVQACGSGPILTLEQVQ